MDADLAFRAIVRAILLPPGSSVLLVVAGLALLRRAPRAGRALIAAGAGFLVVLSMPVTADLLAAEVAVYPMLDLRAPPRADLIVVLGGGMEGSLTVVPSYATLERLTYAARLARATGLPILVSGGGAPEYRTTEAEVMGRTLHDSFGLDARWLETESRTTRENARYTARLLAPLGHPRVLLVTSALHLPRAMREFRAAGVDVLPAPATREGPPRVDLPAWLPRPSALHRSWMCLYELLGQLVAPRTPAT